MSGDTLLRQWALLRAIPVRRDATARELHDQLLAQGFQVDKRTVERDLQELKDSFPLLLNRRGRPYGWRWDPQAKLLDIPGMDPATALTFKLAEAYLTPLLPPSTLAALERHFGRAEEVLGCGNSPLRGWADKVQVVPRGQRLEAPQIAPEVLGKVYQAVLEERRFKADYRKKDGETKRYLVNPLGLVLRDQVAYLVATLWGYAEVVQLVLHRFSGVELLDEPLQAPPDFSLQAYVREHNFDYPVGDTIRLDILLTRAAAQHLAETPLSPDQRWQEGDEDRVRITASVADTQQLRWWLLGFGDQLEVQAPAGLRAEFARIARNLAGRYAATLEPA